VFLAGPTIPRTLVVRAGGGVGFIIPQPQARKKRGANHGGTEVTESGANEPRRHKDTKRGKGVGIMMDADLAIRIGAGSSLFLLPLCVLRVSVVSFPLNYF